MKNYILKIVLALYSLIFSIPILAYPGDPDGGDDPLPDPVPVDNYVWILLFAALLIGAVLIYRKKIRTI